jgi:threonine dehydrogenase-like Zn-dependent dehydrogenase
MKRFRGIVAMAKLAAMMPCTAKTAAEKLGIDDQSAARALRDLRRVGFARVVAVEFVGSRRARANVVDVVDGDPSSDSDGLPRQRRIGVNVRTPVCALAFASLWKALGTVGTVADLVDETGLDPNVIRRALNALHDGGKARIVGWVSTGGNQYAPEWGRGFGPHAARPPKIPRKVQNAKAWARRRDKLRQMQIQAALIGQQQVTNEQREAA